MPGSSRWGLDESSDEQSSDDSPSDSPPSSSLDWSFKDDWEEKTPSESDSDICASMAMEELHPTVTPDGEGEDEEDEDEGYASDFDEEEEHRLRKRIKIWPSPSPLSSDPGSPSVDGEAEEPPQNTGTADDPIIID
jgi:hypothetical protein